MIESTRMLLEGLGHDRGIPADFPTRTGDFRGTGNTATMTAGSVSHICRKRVRAR